MHPKESQSSLVASGILDFQGVGVYHAEESVWLLGRMVEVFETDNIPTRRFQGPLYLSRYGLYIDPTVDPKGADNLERMLALIDGERSCMDIAEKLNVDFYFVRDFCARLAEKGLVESRPRPVRPGDAGTM